jgi:tungstate transport system ATP-binding protein
MTQETLPSNGSGAQPPAAPLFRLRDITQRYGERVVLDLPQLEIAHGEIVAVVGPSGSGKSTLLRLLNFLERPTTGTITFREHTTNGTGDVPLDLRRQVTTVFQRPVLLNTSVIHNVAYGLQLRGVRNGRHLAEAVLADVGLAALAGAHARTLSGGEMQRAALARAMVIQPQVLLLDEPTANLDPHNVALIERAILDMHQRQQTTVIFVTHNVFQARRLAQRVLFLLDGRVIESAPTADFFASPQDPRTAAFVRGDMVY